MLRCVGKRSENKCRLKTGESESIRSKCVQMEQNVSRKYKVKGKLGEMRSLVNARNL